MRSVLLSTDDAILAEGVASLLSTHEGLHLCSWCSHISILTQYMDRFQPDLLLLDTSPEIEISMLDTIRAATSHSNIVLWVTSISTELALQALSAGVRGILRKNLPWETVLRCLTRVDEGELWFDKALGDRMITARRCSLTRREGQLLSLLSQELKNKQIAAALKISEGTVKVYLSRLFQKVGVKGRLELALLGRRNLSSVPNSLGQAATTHLRAWPVPGSFFVERLPPA